MTTTPCSVASWTVVATLALLTTAASCALWKTRRELLGTTLVGPWYWLVGCTLGLAVARIALEYDHDRASGVTTTLPLVAVVGSLCPIVSLLGAKRPQDGAWHLVVLALWIILALPAVESLILQRGHSPDLQGTRTWFMGALILVGLVNGWATRYWPAATLMALAQTLMLSACLPQSGDLLGAWGFDAGLACWLLAIIVGGVLVYRRRAVGEPLDALWLDFRDNFGLLWGLRVSERINSAARQYDWPIELRWHGFHRSPEGEGPLRELPASVTRPLRQTFENLLRRFVSPEWIARRAPDWLDESAG